MKASSAFCPKRAGVAAFASLALASLTLAQVPQEGQEPPAEDADVPAVKLRSGRTIQLFPADDLFPVYVADPHRTSNAANLHFYTRTEIDDSSGFRTSLKAGGRFGVLRILPATPGGRSWQVSIDAGLDAQFDNESKFDNIGWDGNVGLMVTTASGGPFSFKLGVLHGSAHVGDEYAERTGHERIDYSREELAFGLGYRLARRWWAYVEWGLGYDEGTDEQAPWRIQAGLEWESRRTLFGGRFAWYGAIDFSAAEERDWQLDTAIQVGVAARARHHTWRIGVEYCHGRPPLGEFFQDTEGRFTLGIWVDL